MDCFPWGDSRRFHSHSRFMQVQFGGRMQRVAIDAGFTCPNRDGTLGSGGCTYCLNAAFNPSYCSPKKSITQQIDDGILFHRNRRREPHGYLAYFQAFSNTYAPVSILKELFEEAILHPDIQGLVIATRPDCLYEEILDYLEELQQRTYVAIEIGVESCRDETLRSIRRGHDFDCVRRAFAGCHAHHLSAGAHLIFGLPGETPADWLADENIINALPIQHIKFHQLQIFKGTPMEHEYLKQPADFHIFTLEDYVGFIADFLEKLNPTIVIDRLASEVPPRYLAVSHWHNIRYDEIVKRVETELERRDSWQGKKFDKKNGHLQ